MTPKEKAEELVNSMMWQIDMKSDLAHMEIQFDGGT